jgi:RimJ/RimL family protein N-acetyltransferase
VFPDEIALPSGELRPLSGADVFETYERFAADRDDAAEVFAYVPQEPFDALDDAAEWIEGAEEHWSESEIAHYAVYHDGDLAGMAGLVLEWDRRTGTLGVILAKPFWGHGLTGECADALAELSFETLDLELVAIGFEAGNENSERVVEAFVQRHGGGKDAVLRNWTPVGDEVIAHHRYTVTREAWESD